MIDYNALTAYASVAGVIVACLALLSESRRSRFASGVELIQKLDREFRGERLIRVRASAAKGLLTTPPSNSNAVDEIFDFFEEVAFFVRRGAIDYETTWYFFFSYMFRYNTAAAAYISQQRQSDATLWHDFIKIYPRLLRIEQGDRGKLGSRKALTEHDVKSFLEKEALLPDQLSNPDQDTAIGSSSNGPPTDPDETTE